MEVLFVISAILWACSAQYIPPSPCPKLFKYVKQDGKILGEVEFKNDLSGDYSLSVNMSVRAYLTNNENIKLKLVTSSDEILEGQPLTYHVYFPIQNIIPRLTQIEFNRRVYCSGPPEKLTKVGVTSMWSAFFLKFSEPIQPHKRPQEQPPVFEYPGRAPFQPQFTTTTVSYPRQPQYPAFPFWNQNTFRPIFPSTPRPTPSTIATRATTLPTVHTPPRTVHTSPPTKATSPRTKYTTVATSLPTKPTPIQSSLQDPEDECGLPFIQHFIVGGVTVEQGQFPWIVAIMYSRQSSYIYGCTGSLVSKKHVVTAGHCVFYSETPLVPLADLLLVLGKVNIDNWARGAVTRGVESARAHPEYKQNQGDGDIAVLVMDKAVPYEDGIRPICLWQGEDNLANIVGQEGTVVGWGKDESGRNFVTRAKKISVPVVSRNNCLKSHRGFNRLTSHRTFCGGRRDGTGPCTGDSGAGFAMFMRERWVLRGVVSSSLDNGSVCNLDDYLIFSDAAKVLDWLKSVIV